MVSELVTIIAIIILPILQPAFEACHLNKLNYKIAIEK